ncbi:MAG: PAS domain-containing sensor histidine kinase [Candidatus Obscuribacterales bacterium]|nr:PAS domain-containing sensor histidine kinase [Candidatus Obscuribacterales bacterium]
MTIKTEDIYRCLTEHSADGYIVTDLRGGISYCNPAAAKFLGREDGEIVGQKLFAIFDEASLKEKETSTVAAGSGVGGTLAPGSNPLAAIAAGGNFDKHAAHEPSNWKFATAYGKNGVDMTVPASYLPITDKDGKEVGSLTVLYVVQSHTVQQAQTEFVSTVSHELRTPLTSIKGFADTILRAGDRLDLAQQRRYIDIIKQQADRLTRLVEDLLAVSRLESKKLQLTVRAIDLREAIQRVTHILSEKARNHKINEVIPPGLPLVWADADRLEQILTNLIDNAIKYSPAETTVTVVARDVPGTPEMVEFSVADQGGGIPQEHLPEIFSKFSRLDNPLTRQTEGTGLGLYITRSLVVALGGQIKVTSVPGCTTFTVQLPAASLEMQAARGRD